MRLHVCRMIANWAAIESFTLRGCSIGDGVLDGSIVPIWSTHPTLRAVHLGEFYGYTAIQACLDPLPPSVRVLTLDDGFLFEDASFADALTTSAPQLTELNTFDSTIATRRGDPLFHRGGWNDLLGWATGLVRLTLNPWAVSNLSLVLGALAQLEELVLTFYNVVPEDAHTLAKDEVAAYLTAAPALRRLTVGHELWCKWTGGQQYALEREGRAKGVAVELRRESNGAERFVPR